jgi:hypothetical protein
MLDYPRISKNNPPFPAYVDFQALRRLGIDRLQKLSGKIWTDYNLHDPGVTILEVLCYAITDLGYRNNLEIADLLALEQGQPETNFFTPDQILTCNPVTILDLRKRLIDIPGVHNAWLRKVTTYDPPISIDLAHSKLYLTPLSDQSKDNIRHLNPRGLYTVLLDLDPDYRKDACGQLYRPWSDTLDQVKEVLCRYRNLCEDIHEILILGEEEIRLCADIELEPEVDGEDVLVEIYERVQNFLAPELRFYTLPELLEKHKSPAEIFAGRPSIRHYESHGFIDTAELEQLTLKKSLHVSDLYQEILKVNGVVAIKKLLIANYIDGLPQSEEASWYLKLTDQYRPVLGVESSKVNLFKAGLPISINGSEVQRRYHEQRAAHVKTLRNPYELDLPVPTGKRFPDLQEHYSIHHDFPLTYGISEDGLPAPISTQRRAQVRQLKAYLVFFDQLLANYLAQLAHVRELFSWSDQSRQTYFTQPIHFPGVKEDEIIQEYDSKDNYLDMTIAEDPETFRDRRNRFLDHLLARFSESFTDYVLLNHGMFEQHRDRDRHEQHLIGEKARFLKDYPDLSHDRFRAFNYCDCEAVWDTENVSGFKQRVSRLLGIEDARRHNLNHYQVVSSKQDYVVSINCGSPDQELISHQVYDSEAAAQAALEKFLSFALCANFYQRLTYDYFYHYSWEVEATDNEGQLIQARCDTYFLSHHDRRLAQTTLLTQLSNLSEAEKEACIHIQPDDTDQETNDNQLYSFRIEVPLAANEIGGLQFTGVQQYFSRESASTKAKVILQQMEDSRNYRKILWQRDGGAERETWDPSDEAKWIHYGYALVDETGTVLAESRHRFSDSKERDIALYTWLSNLRAEPRNDLKQSASLPSQNPAPSFTPPQPQDQFEFAVQQTTQGFHFVLQDARDDRPVLSGLQYYQDETEAWKNAYTFSENLFHLNCYVGSAQDQTRQAHLVITNASGEQLAVMETDHTPLEAFKQLNSITPFLQADAVQAEPPSYRFRLVNYDGSVLLEGTQFFNDQNTACDRFYSQVLGVLFEPEILSFTNTQAGFGFEILSRPGDRTSQVAVHPQTYASELEREAAVHHLFLLVRTARLAITLQRQPAFESRIYAPDGSIVLRGQRYDTAEAAWKQGDTLMELAAVEVELAADGNLDGKNFRLIQSEPAKGNAQATPYPDLYGWELVNQTENQSFAAHFYSSKQQRDDSIQTIQKLVNDEGLHVLEHILLRPRQPWVDPKIDPEAVPEHFLPIDVDPDAAKNPDLEAFTSACQDPYSFWVSIILPYWPTRFQDIKFRRFVERTLRLEAPAHIVLKIAWINAQQMYEFETAYRAWLEQLAAMTCVGEACDLVGSLNHLIDLLPQLRNVYPQGTLHDPQVSSDRSNPITLNQTALGNIQDEGHEHDD